MNQIASRWEDYECIDAGNGEKLERWKDIILRRPDPLALWPIAEESGLWLQPHARYHRSAKGGGHWEYLKQLPESWNVRYRQLCFKVSPTGFKHTGLFPEQAANWDFMMEKIAGADREIRVLNLFAYTGGATMACAAAGAQEVVHVDAAKGMVQWAKENMVLSHLEDRRIRFIVDDVLKFVAREKRRGRTYHAIIMDPPSYGRGPKGEIWKIEEAIHPLIKLCAKLLSDDPLFFLVNSYTTGLAPAVLTYMIATELKPFHGHVDSQEIGLPVRDTGLVLPCGASGRWER